MWRRAIVIAGLAAASGAAMAGNPYYNFRPTPLSFKCTIMLCKAEAAMLEGYETLAVQFADQVIANDPHDRVAARLIRAQANNYRHHYEEAAADAEAVMPDPDAKGVQVAEAIVIRGRTYSLRRAFDKARADYSAVIAKYKDEGSSYTDMVTDAYAWRSMDYAILGDYDAALADANAAMALEPDDPNAYLNRGFVYFAQGQYKLAAADFAKSQSMRPGFDAVEWTHLANLHAGVDDWPQFATDAGKLKLDEWPGIMLKLYLGQATVHDVDVKVHENDEFGYEATDRECSASFAKAQWYATVQHDKAEALQLYRHMVNVCPLSVNVSIAERAVKAGAP